MTDQIPTVMPVMNFPSIIFGQTLFKRLIEKTNKLFTLRVASSTFQSVLRMSIGVALTSAYQVLTDVTTLPIAMMAVMKRLIVSY